MCVEATRMQDLASEFSKITPGARQREGATPSRTYLQPGLWPGAGRKRPGVGTQTLVPLNFSAVVAPLGHSAFEICYGHGRTASDSDYATMTTTMMMKVHLNNCSTYT